MHRSGIKTVSHIFHAPVLYAETLTLTYDDIVVAKLTIKVVVIDTIGALEDLNDFIQGLSNDDFDKN